MISPEEMVVGLLEETADAFESGRYQHTKQVYAEKDGSVCLLGGLRRTAGAHIEGGVLTGGWTDTFYDAVDELNRDILGPDFNPLNHVIHWNDEPERTVGEVIDALKLTAKRLRNGE